MTAKSLLLCLALFIPPWSGAASAQGPGQGGAGATAPEFVLTGIHGDSVLFPERSVGDTKLTIVVFWSTWSQASLAQLRALSELHSKWANHGIRIVAVNVEASRYGEAEIATVKGWLEANPQPFPVVLDRGLRAFRAYGVIAVPTTFMIESKGLIILRLPGWPVGGEDKLVGTAEGYVMELKGKQPGELPVLSPSRRRAVRQTRLAHFLAAKEVDTELVEYTLARAIEIDPTFLDARLEMAKLHMSRGAAVKASAVLGAAQSAFPEDSRILLALAELSLEQSRTAEAADYARRSLELNPSLSGATIVLARVHIFQNERDLATELLSTAAILNPLDLGLKIELASTYELEGNKEEAIRLYEEAYLLLDPDWNR